jgi:hypothetical protein
MATRSKGVRFDRLESLGPSVTPREKRKPMIHLEKRPFLMLVLVSSFTFTALGATLHGVTMPEAVAVGGKSLKLNGIGVRTKSMFNIKVYVAGLYLEVPSNNAARILAADSARRLELHMTHNAPRDRLMDEFLTGISQNSKGNTAELKERLDKCLATIPDMQEGQTLSLSYVPGKGTVLKAAGRAEVAAPGKDLADAIFLAWLGENPLDSDLKEHLLGKH